MTPVVLRNIFDLTIDEFFRRETQEVLEGVNERNNCGRMALYMQHFAEVNNFHHYFADTEYNRQQDGKIKTILDGEMRVVPINCDLILHSRGQVVAADNLIAIEVKKKDGREQDKQKDRERLRALTKSSYDDVWSYDGIALPEHVCGYQLGAFIELDRFRRNCLIEFYQFGDLVEVLNRSF